MRGPRFIVLSEGFLSDIASAQNFDPWETCPQLVRKASHEMVTHLCDDHTQMCFTFRAQIAKAFSCTPAVYMPYRSVLNTSIQVSDFQQLHKNLWDISIY